VISIGHGGFDGPIITTTLLEGVFTPGQLRKVTESQAGMVTTAELTYDPDESPDFSAYMEANAPQLLAVENDVRDLVGKHVGVDVACKATCISDLKESRTRCANACPDSPDCSMLTDTLRSECIAGCVVECRGDQFDPADDLDCTGQCLQPRSYRIHSDSVPDAAAFEPYAQALQAVTAQKGMVVLEHCNSGTHAELSKDGIPKSVPQLPFHGGPHYSYVDLMADAIGRFVGGPIGQTSWSDAINRVEALERDQQQRFFHIARPH
jgi:hypothetical protein